MAHYSCALAFCIPLESGFVAAKFTVQYSAPFHLLFLRGAFSCLVLLLLTLGFRARFPSGRGMARNLIVGSCGFWVGHAGVIWRNDRSALSAPCSGRWTYLCEHVFTVRHFDNIDGCN